MIVSRFDYKLSPDGKSGYGVGYQVLEHAAFDAGEIDMAPQMLALRRMHNGDGVVALDCGANIGPHTLEWAIAMTGWGSVVAIEAQERLFYALAGNIALNNCFNARALHAAVGATSGTMDIPTPDYFTPSSLGSLELRQGPKTEDIGQAIDYSPAKAVTIRQLTIDELALPRLDFLKIDIEGMELEGLEGARKTIEAHTPVILVEYIKIGIEPLKAWLEAAGYVVMHAGINLLAIHKTDKTLKNIQPQAAPPPAAG